MADTSLPYSQNPIQTAHAETISEAYTETDEQGANNVARKTDGETYAVTYVKTYFSSLGQAHNAADGQTLRSSY